MNSTIVHHYERTCVSRTKSTVTMNFLLFSRNEEGKCAKQNIQLFQSLNFTCLAESKENEQHSGFMLFFSGIALEF